MLTTPKNGRFWGVLGSLAIVSASGGVGYAISSARTTGVLEARVEANSKRLDGQDDALVRIEAKLDRLIERIPK